LAWNNTNLIGVLAENVLSYNSTKHIITINLQDYTVTDLGITFTEDRISSMKKINSKLYLPTWGEGFLVIDLMTQSVTNLSTIHGSRLTQIITSELALLQPISSTVNGARPAI